MCIDPWFEKALVLLIYGVLWFHFFLGYYLTHGWCFFCVHCSGKYSFWQYYNVGVVCYDHALLVTGYDVLLSTLQGDLSFSASSASSFASTHAGPDHFHRIDLRLRHHA